MNRLREAVKQLGGFEAARVAVIRQRDCDFRAVCEEEELMAIAALALYALDVLEKPLLKFTSPVQAAIEAQPRGHIVDPASGGTIELLRCQNCEQLASAAKKVTSQERTTLGLAVPAGVDFTKYYRVPVAFMAGLIDAIDRSEDTGVE